MSDLDLCAIAERIVDARKSSHQTRAYDYCPCCGYDGVWPGDRDSAVALVLAMLMDAKA